MSDNNELNGFLALNVGELEAALQYVKSNVDERLLDEATEIIDRLLDDETWYKFLDHDKEFPFFSHVSWRAPEAKKNAAHAYWVLEERLGLSKLEDETWLATFLAAGPGSTTAVLGFWQEYVSAAIWKKHLKKRLGDIEKLKALGISYDESAGALYIPVVLNAEVLAQAFRKDDFSDVFEPLERAVKAASSAFPIIEPLIQSVRGKTKA